MPKQDDKLPRLENGYINFALLGREIYHGVIHINISPASIQNLLERIAAAETWIPQPRKKK